MISATKHDRYVIELCKRLRDTYDILLTNVKLERNQRLIGEIDIYARKGTRVDIYEVKCSYRIAKAKKQLKKVKAYLKLKDVHNYFYCGNSDLLIKLEDK